MRVKEQHTLNRINATSAECYAYQGPGTGAGKSARDFYESVCGIITERKNCLDVGYGDGTLIESLIERDCLVAGVDIANACSNLATVNHANACCYILDICHDQIPLADDSIELAFCTETIEHLANPYHMVAEVKRVLRHGGMFTLAFPMPESNLGC